MGGEWSSPPRALRPPDSPGFNPIRCCWGELVRVCPTPASGEATGTGKIPPKMSSKPSSSAQPPAPCALPSAPVPNRGRCGMRCCSPPRSIPSGVGLGSPSPHLPAPAQPRGWSIPGKGDPSGTGSERNPRGSAAWGETPPSGPGGFVLVGGSPQNHLVPTPPALPLLLPAGYCFLSK